MSKPSQATILGKIRTSYPRLLHILVPMDFSGKSRQALRYAVPLALKFSARIHLVHVLPPPNRKDPAGHRQLKMVALKRLGLLATSLLPKPIRAEHVVLSGHAAEEILALAAANDIDLIVLTTKASLPRKRDPGTAETIMRRATCPVMSIRRH